VSASATGAVPFALCVCLAACTTSSPEARRPSVAPAVTRLITHSERGTGSENRADESSTNNSPADPATSARRAPIALGHLTETERGIGLLEVLRLAETQGIDVQLADERLREARAEADIARAAWWPELHVGTTLYRNEGRVQNTQGRLLDVDKQNAWTGGQLRMEFDLGQAIYGSRSARRAAEASAFATETTANDSVTLAALAYFDLLESYARLPIAADALEHAEQLVTFERARVDGGTGLESELARALSHRAAVQRATIQMRAQAQLASATLVELLQLDPAKPLAPDADGLGALELVTAELAPSDGLANEHVLKLALGARPELREADSRVAVGEADEEQADRAWMLPTVFLGARFGALGWNYSDLESQDVYTAAVSWDLGARLFGERDRGRSRRRQAELERVRMRSAILREVQTAAAELDAAGLSIEATELEVQAARSAHDLAAQRHALGAALLIEVLDSQVQFLRARVARAEAVASYNRAQFAYLRAVGLFGVESDLAGQ